MLLWVIIIFGVLIAFLLRNRSLYSNWTTAFNTAASIYLSVMLAPVMLGFLSAETSWKGYHCAGFILLASIILFVILEVIAAYVLVVEEVDISFPRIVEFVGSKLAGFVTGFCTAGLIVFLVTVVVMQYEYQPWMKFLRTADEPLRVSVASVERTCGVIHNVSLQRYSASPENVVIELTNLEDNEAKKPFENKANETIQIPDILTPGK